MKACIWDSEKIRDLIYENYPNAFLSKSIDESGDYNTEQICVTNGNCSVFLCGFTVVEPLSYSKRNKVNIDFISIGDSLERGVVDKNNLNLAEELKELLELKLNAVVTITGWKTYFT